VRGGGYKAPRTPAWNYISEKACARANGRESVKRGFTRPPSHLHETSYERKRVHRPADIAVDGPAQKGCIAANEGVQEGERQHKAGPQGQHHGQRHLSRPAGAAHLLHPTSTLYMTGMFCNLVVFTICSSNLVMFTGNLVLVSIL
jgi:hypothetical protein